MTAPGQRFRLAFALAGMLGACTPQGSVVTGVDYEANYQPIGHLGYLSGGPDVETVVVGELGADPDGLADAIAAALNAHRRGPLVRYTTDPENEASPGYRMVMAVGVGPIRGGALCAAVENGTDIEGDGTPGLQAAFCYRERRISEAFVQRPAFAGAADPSLDHAVAVAMNRVFPLTLQPDNGGNCMFC